MRRLVAGALFVGACSAPHGFSHSPDGNPQGGLDGPILPGDSSTDGAATDASTTDAAWTWSTLIANPSWSIQGVNTSTYTPVAETACAQIPIGSDVWIDGFRPGSGGVSDMVGVGQSNWRNDHRFVIVSSVGCGGGEYSYTWHKDDEIVFAAGLGGSAELDLPAGTAVHLSPKSGSGAQNYLLVYDSLVNFLSGSEITGSSQIEAHFVDASAVQHEVDMVLAGQAVINVPAGSTSVVQDGCAPIQTAGYSWNVVALWPHMHDSGQHSAIWLNSGSATPLVDADYDFKAEQNYVLASPSTMSAGDTLWVQCTLDNEDEWSLTYNEVLPEQTPWGKTVCWTGVYKYPPGTDTMTGTPTGPETCVGGLGAQGFEN